MIILTELFQLQDVISKLEVRCSSNDCSWRETVDEWQHHNAICPEVEAACSHKGCGFIGKRSALGIHEENCPHSDVKNAACPLCAKEMERYCFMILMCFSQVCCLSATKIIAHYLCLEVLMINRLEK